MKYGYDIVLGDSVLNGFFVESDLVSEKKNGDYTNRIYEVTIENKIVARLCEEEDLIANVTMRRLEIENRSSEKVTVKKANITTILDIPYATLNYFTSDWGSEYSPVNLDVTYEISIGTYTGRSSKGCDPFFTVGWENQGFMGVTIGWSGNWKADFKRLDGENYFSVGLLDQEFSTEVLPSEKFDNIEIFYSFSLEGTEKVSSCFRQYYRRNITMFDENMESLPVEYNHWWPYEDKYINEDIFYENVKIARDLGFSNSLLDAGWFGPAEEVDVNKSMPWFLKRGDWDLVNTKLFPSGIEALGEKVNKLGIKFGIWCEIEAVGDDANFNQAHPELIARRKGESLKYVCMGNPKSVEWALDITKTLVETYGAGWIKFDFNLDPGLGCDCKEHGHGSGDGLYAHYRGYYQFLEELHKRYPDVIIENCSSGGLRIDYGLMKRSHVAFLSDPDFTKHHLQCYWGATSYIHPSSCMHFTWSETVCDHNLVRIPIVADTSPVLVDYMIRTVLTGVPGFSLKFIDLPEWVKIKIKEHVDFYKKVSKDFILNGEMFRLTEQTRSALYKGENWNAYQFSSSENRQLAFVYKMNDKEVERNIKFRNLNEDYLYNVYFHNNKEHKRFTGAQLMKEGLIFSSNHNEWSEIIEIEKDTI